MRSAFALTLALRRVSTLGRRERARDSEKGLPSWTDPLDRCMGERSSRVSVCLFLFVETCVCMDCIYFKFCLVMSSGTQRSEKEFYSVELKKRTLQWFMIIRSYEEVESSTTKIDIFIWVQKIIDQEKRIQFQNNEISSFLSKCFINRMNW